MGELTERFIEAYEYLKANNFVANDTDFATKLSVSRAMVTEIVKRRSNAGAKALQNIVKEFPIDGNWLLTGLGEIDKTTKKLTDTPVSNNHVHEPAVSYNTNTPTTIGKDIASKRAKLDPPTDPPTVILQPQIITVDKQGNENIIYVPVKAAAGYLVGYSDPEFIENLPSFSLPGLSNSTYRAFEVDGDSMYPTLENKEMVIGQWVEKLDYIREDRVHIIVTKTGVLVKRLLNRIDKYGYIIAKSDAIDNRNLYPNIEIHPEDILEVWYAVWHGSFNFKSPTELYKKVNNLEADLTEVLRVLKANNLLNK